MTKINYKWYFCHHIIWFLQTGEWPSMMIDHKDQDKLNNRWDNLRLGTKEIQYSNKPKRTHDHIYSNQSVLGKGIYFRRGRYEVYLVRNKIRHYLGVFQTVEAAQEAIDEFNKRS